MVAEKNTLDQTASQLKEACKASGARWIVWLQLDKSDWVFSVARGITTQRKRILSEFIRNPKTASWLAGALSSGRLRSRSTGKDALGLGCQRIYAFPCQSTHRILVVGADGMNTYAENLLRILAMQPLTAPLTNAYEIANIDISPWPQNTGLDTSYDPEHTFQRILEYLTNLIPCQHAFLAIRSGDTFQIKANWSTQPGQTQDRLRDSELSISDDEFLTRVVASHKGSIVNDVKLISPQLRKVLGGTEGNYMCVPILIGQRVIGIVAFLSNTPEAYTPGQLQLITWYTNWLAYSIENTITIQEVTHYLEQLALLNDLASIASLGIESIPHNPQDEFARRVMTRLRRVFQTDWAAVLLLSADGQTLDEVGGGSRMGSPWSVSISDNIIGRAVCTGQPIRVENLLDFQPQVNISADFCSELAVPLKYRGKVIGALVLVSKDTSAFSQPDEQLLVLIASHMAGFFENMRLNEETRERAQRLADNVRLLHAVRDTSLDIAGDLDLDTLLTRVTQRARDLIGARGAELGLYNTHEQAVEIVVSDTPWNYSPGEKIPLMAGVPGRMAAFGEPIIVNNYNQWSGRLSHDQQETYHAVAGVPLKFRGEVIGTLTVLDDRADKIFTNDDLHLLELLAPQAAISIRNARIYQELETRIKAQRVAEARLIRSARLAAVGEMAAGIAHELNNPLTTVTGFVELVLGELPADSQQKLDLELVLEEAKRARGVIRRLLDFSRPAEDERIRTDLNELILQVLPLVDHLARTGGVTIRPHLRENIPWISVDPNQIKQVLLNLVHNGLQSMPKGGLLTISTLLETRNLSDKSSEYVAIQIHDNGEGIPSENLERIFEPFFSTRPSGQGTGLGLSVSYGIITSHGGWIEVESAPGEGSCFTIYLPTIFRNC